MTNLKIFFDKFDDFKEFTETVFWDLPNVKYIHGMPTHPAAWCVQILENGTFAFVNNINGCITYEEYKLLTAVSE